MEVWGVDGSTTYVLDLFLQLIVLLGSLLGFAAGLLRVELFEVVKYSAIGVSHVSGSQGEASLVGAASRRVERKCLPSPGTRFACPAQVVDSPW
jgi:hypothetical protein